MNLDLYTRTLLSIIAVALVYLCVVMTPLPTVSAQRASIGAQRPGDDTGPARVIIVGWQPGPSASPLPVEVVTSVPVSVAGTVQTEQRPNTLSRITVAGWEENATAVKAGLFYPLRRENRGTGLPSGVPVTTIPVTGPSR